MDHLDGSPQTYGGHTNKRKVCRSRGAETRGGDRKATGVIKVKRSLGAGPKAGGRMGKKWGIKKQN